MATTKMEKLTRIGGSVAEYVSDKIARLAPLDDDAFIVTNISEIQERLDRWKDAFPDIQPFFALKAQDNFYTRKLLAANGCGFDVASLGELKSVLEEGVTASDIIYGQPYKQPSHLHFALGHGVISVCDTVDEIKKLGEVALMISLESRPKILLRILPDDKEGDVKGKLSSKFGASIERLSDLADAADECGVDVVGISFHVGSHCHSAEPYVNTLKLSRQWWAELEKKHGCCLTMLDVGGGYPGERHSNFKEMAKRINLAIELHYGDIRNRIKILAEPGRYMVTSSSSVVVNVIAEKDVGNFVLNTGVYGGLSSSVWDRTAAKGSLPYLIKRRNAEQPDADTNGDATYVAGDVNGHADEDTRVLNGQNGSCVEEAAKKTLVLWGPTCDSSDRLVESYFLRDVERGDWIVFPDLGAYGSNIMTTFNGFEQPKMEFVYTDRHGVKIEALLAL